MSTPVAPEEIEGIVGAARHATEHLGRAVSAEQQMYILHSAECLLTHRDDLRFCPYSLALDEHGIEPDDWEDRTVFLTLDADGQCAPQRMTTSLGAVLSHALDILVVEITEAWPLQDFLLGRKLVTHQRGAPESDVGPRLLEQFPALRGTTLPAHRMESFEVAAEWIAIVSKATGIPLSVEVYR